MEREREAFVREGEEGRDTTLVAYCTPVRPVPLREVSPRNERAKDGQLVPKRDSQDQRRSCRQDKKEGSRKKDNCNALL